MLVSIYCHSEKFPTVVNQYCCIERCVGGLILTFNHTVFYNTDLYASNPPPSFVLCIVNTSSHSLLIYFSYFADL